MSRKIHFSDLERENEKLVQDIDEIQHILAVHKEGINRDQERKDPTRTSVWVNGGEGPLSGFKSHKCILDNISRSRGRQQRGLSDALNSKQKGERIKERDHRKPVIEHSRSRSTGARNTKEGRKPRPRRVSFKITDDMDGLEVVKKDGHESRSLEIVNKDVVDLDHGSSTGEKIASLKMKVLAKANSKVKLEMKRKKSCKVVGKIYPVSTEHGGGILNKEPGSNSASVVSNNRLKKNAGDELLNSSSISSLNSDRQPFECVKDVTKAVKGGTGLDDSEKGGTGLDDSVNGGTGLDDKSDLIGHVKKNPIRVTDPDALVWLQGIDFPDEESYEHLKVMVTSNRLAPAELNTMTEKDWIKIGIINPAVLACISSIKSESIVDKNKQSLFKITNSLDDSIEVINHTENTLNKKRPFSAKDLTRQQRALNIKPRPSSAITTSRSNQDKFKKVSQKITASKSTPVRMSTAVASKAGVTKASQKLKQKQDQQEQIRRKHEKEARQRKAERDRMAAQHLKRLEEKTTVDNEREEEEVEKGTEENIDDNPTQNNGMTRKTISVVAEGIPVPEGFYQKYPASIDKQSEPPIDSCELEETTRNTQALAEEQLKKIELQVIGLQDNPTGGDMSVESNILRLQKQLADIQKELCVQPGKESSKTSPVRTKERKGLDTLHSRTELMREVRKQKEQHRKEIKLLESELVRLRHRDPVKTCELPKEDIYFTEQDVIGEGTFSQVFCGKFNGSEVAIKRLKHSLSSSDKNYFAEEVNLLHELRHPRIVLLIGVCTTGKLPLMVLEYMASGSLHRYLHDKNKPTLDHVSFYQISKDIALGMTYLHRHKPPVLHLDLKSLNILLSYYGRAKIADFGFSKLKHDAEEISGGLRGTPSWMAPELLDQSLGCLSIKADVYSFGVVLWEMFTRETPYQGMSVYQILEFVRRKRRPTIPPSCPEPLYRLITSCWEQTPSQRPSFKEILIALEALNLPPEWRSLLSSAGIPCEIMQEPDSARSIINLINQSVEISVLELNKLSLGIHDEQMKDDVSLADNIANSIVEQNVNVGNGHSTVKAPPPPPLIELAKFVEAHMKASKIRQIHSEQGVSIQQQGFTNPKQHNNMMIPASDLAEQKSKLRTTTEGLHPCQLANLNIVTEEKITSIAEVLRMTVNKRRLAMQMDSINQSTLDSNWSNTGEFLTS